MLRIPARNRGIGAGEIHEGERVRSRRRVGIACDRDLPHAQVCEPAAPSHEGASRSIATSLAAVSRACVHDFSAGDDATT